MAVSLSALTKANQKRWDSAKITRAAEFKAVAKRLVKPEAKVRYQEIERATGVPWFVVAVIHERESSADFTTQLGQGDPLSQVSSHVPKGRGPFLNHPGDPPLQDAFYRGALDALIDCAPHASRWKDWSPGGTMTLLEQYNGLAYANHGMPSPYIWSGTNQYKIGKITRDHGPIEPIVDTQLGCAGLILAMMELDNSIKFGAPTLVAPRPGTVAVPPQPSTTTSTTVAKTGTAGGAVIAGSIAAQQAAAHGYHWGVVVAILIVTLAIASIIMLAWKKG